MEERKGNLKVMTQYTLTVYRDREREPAGGEYVFDFRKEGKPVEEKPDGKLGKIVEEDSLIALKNMVDQPLLEKITYTYYVPPNSAS